MNDFIKKILPVKIRKSTEEDVENWAEILHQSSEAIYSQYISREYMNNNYSIKRLKERFLQEVNEVNGISELYMLTLDGISIGILKLVSQLNIILMEIIIIETILMVLEKLNHCI